MRFEESGSLTLAGMWMLVIFMWLGTILFLVGFQETEQVAYGQQQMKWQLAVESLLEEKRVALQNDFSTVREMMNSNASENYIVNLDTGKKDGMSYRIRYFVKDEKMYLIGAIKNEDDGKLYEFFCQQWVLGVDYDNEQLYLEGMG